MVYGIYMSAAGLQTNQYRMEVLANNLANTDTPGFKHDLAVVRERLVASRERMAGLDAGDQALDGMTGGSLVAPTVTSFEQGPIEMTDRPLDVAINGEGFFRVETPQGERYTRDGRFLINADGGLVTAAGFHPVLNANGTPIVLPPEAASAARIDGGGVVRAKDTSYGRLGVVGFDDQTLLRKTGGNLVESLGATSHDVTADLRSGALEKSTVDPTRAMVTMIEVSRAYELNSTMVGLADATLGRAVNDIGRIR